MLLGIPVGLPFYGFHVLAWISILLAIFLFATYQRAGHNILLCSLCFVLTITLLIIEIGFFVYGREPWSADTYGDFCLAQALILNYCFISIQAHAACMMVNNCLMAAGWNFGKWAQRFDRTIVFMVVSFVVPLIPLGILYFNIIDYNQHVFYPFFGFVPAALLMWSTTIWFLLFALTGSVAAVYLMVKTILLRRRTIEMTSHSQISATQLVRLFLSLTVYMIMSLGSTIPLLFVDSKNWTQPDSFLASPQIKSPWTNAILCSLPSDTDDRMLYYARTRCPNFMALFPSFIGIGLFIMYGFGAQVKAVFKQMRLMANRILQAPKRRTSMLPGDIDLIDDTASTSREVDSPSPPPTALPSIKETRHEGERQVPESPLSKTRRRG